MVKFRQAVSILRVTDNVLNQELLEKQKTINNRNIISKTKLIDYAVIKTYSPELLLVLRQDKDYNKFLRLYEQINK